MPVLRGPAPPCVRVAVVVPQHNCASTAHCVRNVKLGTSLVLSLHYQAQGADAKSGVAFGGVATRCDGGRGGATRAQGCGCGCDCDCCCGGACGDSHGQSCCSCPCSGSCCAVVACGCALGCCCGSCARLCMWLKACLSPCQPASQLLLRRLQYHLALRSGCLTSSPSSWLPSPQRSHPI